MINKDKSKITSHSEEVIALYKSLTRTVILMMVTAFTLVFVAVAWFVANSSVSGNNAPVYANGSSRYYLATKASDTSDIQGVYDNSNTSTKLKDALVHFMRIDENVEVEGLPEFNPGSIDSKFSDYILGNNESISLRVNSDNNVNNTTDNDYIGPGSRGQITFYIIPLVSGTNTANFTITITPYELVNSGMGMAAKKVTDKTLNSLINGHILLFQNVDDGYYSNQIYPTISNESISFQYTSVSEWTENVPIPITLQWVWPYRFENILYAGQQGSIFEMDPSESGNYKTYLNWIDNTKNMFVYNGNNNGDYSKPDPNMSNSEFSKWSNGYNRADQYIGDRAAYFVWTISSDE